MRKSNMEDYFNSLMMTHSRHSSLMNREEFNPAEFVREGISERDLCKLKETFDLFDIDKSGFISPIKLRAAFKNYANLSPTRETIFHMICEFDYHENGELTFSDFVKLASPLYKPTPTPQSVVKKMFDEFDKADPF